MPTEPKKTSTPTLISALRILAAEVESDDGVANMTIAEGADRIEELSSENARLENLTVSGVHSCSTSCQRPMCVLRRERDEARAELARVTNERDELWGARENAEAENMELLAAQEKHEAQLAALRRELDTTCAELARRNLDDGELRQSHAKIYAAIGTQEADHTKWPEQIAALRRDKARLLDALDSVVSTLQDTDNSRADNSWKAERICNDVLSAMKGGRDE